LFGLAVRFRKNNPDRLTRLAAAIEALGDRDRELVEETRRVAGLRVRGAAELHELCQDFVARINEKLSTPALVFSPREFREQSFNDQGPNLFQINLRGRLLQVEFHASEELFSTDDFKLPYVLRGAVRSFNQESLNSNSMDEQMIFYCPTGDLPAWHFIDGRSYRTGRVDADYLTDCLERLL
jgi:hypothetical protein